MTNPNEPTLTCSEVVERLPMKRSPAEKFFSESGRDGFTEMAYGFSDAQRDIIFQFADKFAEWRERRVQELEECLRAVSLWLNKELKELEIVPTSSFGPRSEGYAAAKVPDWLIKQKVEIIDEVLAKSDSSSIIGADNVPHGLDCLCDFCMEHA